MEERKDGQDEVAELGQEIEGLFAGLRNKENFYLGRIASLEEQIGLLREAQLKAASDREGRERAMRERLAKAEAAAAAGGELTKLRGERDALAERLNELQAALSGEKEARAELELRIGELRSALENKDKELRNMWAVLERAKRGLLAQRDELAVRELQIAEKERISAEQRAELESRDRRLALIVDRLKAAASPPDTARNQPAAGGADDAGYKELFARYEELNGRLLQLEESRNVLERELAEARRENEELKAGRRPAEEASLLEDALRIPGEEEGASEGGADKYRELLARYDELGERLLQLEERKNALERELEEEERQKKDLRKKNLQIQQEVDVRLLAADEKMRRKDVELEELKAALEKMKRVR